MTKIEWVKNKDGSQGRSWNPITGCTKISPGCKNCYAERMARRLAGRVGYPSAPDHFRVTLHPGRLEQPLRRKKPTAYFVCSMSDLFHNAIESLDSTFIREVFAIMALSQQHTFMLLTKRPHVAKATLTKNFADNLEWAIDGICADNQWCSPEFQWPLPNVWLGVSIETPEYSYRSHYLRETPAAIRFISFEPLLASFADYPGVLDDIDWVIVGGESGPGARPMDPDWVRDIRDQCVAANVPLFFKQWGAWLPFDQRAEGVLHISMLSRQYCGHAWHVGKKAAGRQLDGKEWNEMPTGAEPPQNGPRQ